MDPTANKDEQLRIAAGILELYEDESPNFGEIADLAARLAELVQALDEWLSKGGFLPKEWER